MSDEPRAQQADQAIDPGTDPKIDPAIHATAIPILEFGRAWMMAPTTAARAGELELNGPLGFWTLGRAGALGEVGPDVAAAAIGFMAPTMVRDNWAHRPAGVGEATIALEYAEAAAAFGRSTLAAISEHDLVELTTLCDKISAAAEPSVGMLFAAWRAQARPEDPAGAATVALNVLRELRGGAHLSAVQAAGIGAHGAIMAADDPVRGGPAGAARFGWPEPHPEPDVARRALAEDLTTMICRPAYAALDDAELERFVALVGAARATLDA